MPAARAGTREGYIEAAAPTAASILAEAEVNNNMENSPEKTSGRIECGVETGPVRIRPVDLDALQKPTDDGLGDFGTAAPPDSGSPFLPSELRALGIKAGDDVMVRHGYKEQRATFTGYHPERPKYPISYTLNGKQWKGPIACILGKAPAAQEA